MRFHPLSLDQRPALNAVLAWEKELLGLYVSGHPYAKIHEAMKGLLVNCANIAAQKMERLCMLVELLNETIVTKR